MSSTTSERSRWRTAPSKSSLRGTGNWCCPSRRIRGHRILRCSPLGGCSERTLMPRSVSSCRCPWFTAFARWPSTGRASWEGANVVRDSRGTSERALRRVRASPQCGPGCHDDCASAASSTLDPGGRRPDHGRMPSARHRCPCLARSGVCAYGRGLLLAIEAPPPGSPGALAKPALTWQPDTAATCSLIAVIGEP